MQTATALALTKDDTDLVERIAAQIQPGQIILFRAPASGTAGPESDVDLLGVPRLTVVRPVVPPKSIAPSRTTYQSTSWWEVRSTCAIPAAAISS